MNIIKKVEINYFRSIYSLQLGKLASINVFLGNNDAGKSNILKAMNLFFKNKTELRKDIDFLEDLSKHRQKEVREIKGRATIWVKIVFENFLNWTSLPEEFSIKRTWNRYDEFFHQEVFPNDIPGTTIGRFLNKIEFQYIPAVRGRDIFSYYLGLLHDSLIEDKQAGIRGASTELIEKINSSISEMSDSIESSLGFSSNIEVPEDLKQLFEALDFSTSFADHKVALQRRGDGIQARHIPFILGFIANQSKKFHIWAYEEPENSLELRRAFELAEQFEKDFSRENQIFITTHSPAFYDIHGEHATKWLIRSELSGERQETTASQISEQGIADNELGIAILVKDRARELYNQISVLEEDIKNVADKLQNSNKSTLIVEGIHDKTILETAIEKLGYNDKLDINIIPAEGASNLAQFFKGASRVNIDRERSILGLMDNDAEGRKQEKSFSKFHFFEGTQFRTINTQDKLYLGLLPVPVEFSEVVKVFRKFGTDTEGLPLTIEMAFEYSTINRACEENIIEFEEIIKPIRNFDLKFEVNLTELIKKELPDEYWYFAYRLKDGVKEHFANYVKNLEPDSFVYLRPLVEGIHAIAG